MSTNYTLTRRTALSIAGTAVVAGLAGCSSARGTSKPQKQYVTLTALGGAKADSQGRLHDTFAPLTVDNSLSLLKGVPAEVTVYNYDEMAHSIVAPKLDLNVTAVAASDDGTPAVRTQTITPTDAGTFDWACTVPCDKEYNGWAMTQDGYMKGTFDVTDKTDSQTILTTVQAGLKAGSDGKLHDAFSPADFTVTKGIPVTMVVQNFDDGPHSVTAPKLGLDEHVDAATGEGDPATTTFTFTPTDTGTFDWACTVPCDDDANGWAMTHDGYMKGTITVVD